MAPTAKRTFCGIFMHQHGWVLQGWTTRASIKTFNTHAYRLLVAQSLAGCFPLAGAWVGYVSRKALTMRRSQSVPWRFPVSTNTAGDCWPALRTPRANPHACWLGLHTPSPLLLGGGHLSGRYPASFSFRTLYRNLMLQRKMSKHLKKMLQTLILCYSSVTSMLTV